MREADREKVVRKEPALRHQCLHVLAEPLLSVPRSEVLNTTWLFLAEQLKSAFNSKPQKNPRATPKVTASGALFSLVSSS